MSSAFIAIKILIWHEFDFGQTSKATSKKFAKIPFKLLDDPRFLRLTDSSRFHFIRILISCQSRNDPRLILRRSLFESSSKSSLNTIVLPLIESKLIEITDGAVLVKKKREEKEENKEEEKNKNKEKEEDFSSFIESLRSSPQKFIGSAFRTVGVAS